jgi:hypothetical protein
MFNIHNIFKNCSRLSKDYSPNIKTTEKSIECLGKNKNTSLDFSSTPLKQNKKLIKRNTRTNSFNSLIINNTEAGFYNPYSYIAGINQNNNTKIKGFSGYKSNHQKNKSFNIKKGIFNINKQNMLLQKNKKKNNKRNFLNSYFINPNNVHISFNTVGNNFQIDSQQSIKQNKNYNTMMNNLFNKTSNNSEYKKSISIINKKRSNKKFNIINEINNIIQTSNEEKQKLILNEFKLFLNILNKIKFNKNNDININKNDLPLIKKGGIFGFIIYQNYKFRQKNEELENKLNNINTQIEEIKKNKKNIKQELENKDTIIKNLNDKMDIFNKEMIKMKNIINNINIKNSIGDLENISIAENSNINNELLFNEKNNSNKKMKKNKSGKNLKKNDNLEILNFSNNVGSANFNDEFLKNYENFSESWRKEVDKMLQRRGIKLNAYNNKK